MIMGDKESQLSQNINNYNSDFCDFLIELAEYEKNVNRNIHKYNAYKKAAGVLSSLGKRIESGDEAKKLKGIGEKISKKIDEFIQTGHLRKLEKIYQDEEATAIRLLTRVTGIGPVKALELCKSGIKTIHDLRQNMDKLNHHQIIGVTYFEDLEIKIPRSEVAEIETKLKRILSEMDKQIVATICGSYRRGKQECGDIDVLVTQPSYRVNTPKRKGELLRRVVDTLTPEVIADTISIGDTKFMGICRLSKDLPARRLDIRLLPYEQYYCGTLYFTGSDVFNKTMRAHALEKGFTLNEYCLRHIGVTGVPGEPVHITSEQDIFDYLDYPYKRPEERNM